MKKEVSVLINAYHNHQRKFIIIGITLFVLILIISICLKVSYSILSKEPSKEDILNKYLIEIGTDFYENFYYKQIGDNEDVTKDFLSKLKDSGISINLNNLSLYNYEENKEKLDAFINEETNEPCDFENTRVIIYPEEPYGKSNYHIDSVLICENK